MYLWAFLSSKLSKYIKVPITLSLKRYLKYLLSSVNNWAAAFLLQRFVVHVKLLRLRLRWFQVHKASSPLSPLFMVHPLETEFHATPKALLCSS